MLKLLSNLRGQPVVAQQLGKPIGAIDDWVIDPERGQVVAFELTGRQERRFLSGVDIINHLDAGLVVAGEDALQSVDELVRVKKLIDDRCTLIGSKVVTEKGKRLGKVRDCLIDSAGLFIAKLYVQPNLLDRVFSEEMILPREHIVKMTPREVIVRYDMKASSPGIEPEIASQ